MNRVLMIDGGYLSHMEEFSKEVNIELLIKNIMGSNNAPNKIIYYDASPQNKNMKIIFESKMEELKKIKNLELELGHINRGVQKKVDGFINRDIMKLTSEERLEELHLIAGDSDFVPCLKCIDLKKVRVFFYVKSGHYSQEYQEVGYIKHLDANIINASKPETIENLLLKESILLKDDENFVYFSDLGMIFKKKYDLKIKSFKDIFSKLNNVCNITYKNGNPKAAGIILK